MGKATGNKVKDLIWGFYVLFGINLIAHTVKDARAENVMCGAYGLLALVLIISAIVTSQKRLLSFFFAIGAALLVLVLGVVAMGILIPAHGSVIDVNEVADRVGMVITVLAPFAAMLAAAQPPRREKS